MKQTTIKNPFIGPQGQTCRTYEALEAARADYAKNFLTFIGPQGQTCRTYEALEAARADYERIFMTTNGIPIIYIDIKY